jgi:hypothetical protein
VLLLPSFFWVFLRQMTVCQVYIVCFQITCFAMLTKDIDCGSTLALEYIDHLLDYNILHQGLVCRLEVT